MSRAIGASVSATAGRATASTSWVRYDQQAGEPIYWKTSQTDGGNRDTGRADRCFCRIHLTAGMALCPDGAIALSFSVLQTLEAS